MIKTHFWNGDTTLCKKCGTLYTTNTINVTCKLCKNKLRKMKHEPISWQPINSDVRDFIW